MASGWRLTYGSTWLLSGIPLYLQMLHESVQMQEYEDSHIPEVNCRLTTSPEEIFPAICACTLELGCDLLVKVS
jgi:hypothetical protein